MSTFQAHDSPRQPPSLGIGDRDQFVADSFLSNQASLTPDSQLENVDNGGGVEKRAWNNASNDSVAAEVTGAVMGVNPWPGLLEAARASPKSSLKALSQPLVAVSQEMVVGTLSSPKDVVRGIGNSSHVSMLANGNLSRPPPTQGAVVETTPISLVKSGGWVKESSGRDSGQRGRFYGGNEVHPQQRGSFRRNNTGPLFRGDAGSHNGNIGGKRDQHVAQRKVGSRPFLRGTSPNAPFIPHPHPQGVMRPFVTSMVYGDMPSPVFYLPGPHPDPLRPMPMVPIPSIFFPPIPDHYLHSEIVKQIDYYFSNENLVKDIFLRKNMNNEGWVPIKLIAGFKKVMQLTDNIQLILHSIQSSNVVEVQGDKVRRRNDWNKWIMPPIANIATSPRSIIQPSQNMLATHGVALGGKATTST